MRNIIIAVLTATSVFLFVLSGSAIAKGCKNWNESGGCPGYGGHHRGYHGQGAFENMSVEDYKQFEQKRIAFAMETQDIRANLFSKERALRIELAKDDPDVSKATQLQKELSDLQAQFDQKRLIHVIEMRKISPKLGRGFMHGGPMMGYGSHKGGRCWQ
jgi:Spy/CpxP family protein refolding chaperone